MRILDVDFDLSFLREVTGVLDAQLDRIDREVRATHDEEILERANHIYGLGFVACQNYLSETISLLKVERDEALDFEPVHVRSGIPIAALTNSAANFWKHRAEWPSPPPPSKRAVMHIRALGVELSAPFPLANAFYELVRPHPSRFHVLLPFLQRWRDSLRKHVGR